MLDRESGLPAKQPNVAAASPTKSETRVEDERSVDQGDGGVDVLAKTRQHEGSLGKNNWIISADSEGLPSKIDAHAAVRLPVVDPAVEIELVVTNRRESEGRAVAWIALDCLPEEVECLSDPVLIEGARRRESTQVQIVGGEIMRRSF